MVLEVGLQQENGLVASKEDVLAAPSVQEVVHIQRTTTGTCGSTGTSL